MSRHYGLSGSSGSNVPEVQPRRLELTLNPENGSLFTAPLTHVLLTATDGLYQELYNMTQGELDVTAAAPGGENEAAEDAATSAALTTTTKRERLSNLSFAQRRHEIAWRLAQHGKGLQHVAGLCAAAASSDIAQQVRVSSTALQHARTAWVQADEAQDALFFFHAQLFPVRASPHDIYGAADVLLQGRWYDLPTDLRLVMDPYETSRAADWNKATVQEEWQLAIHDKLLTGEVGWMRRQRLTAPWKVTMRGSRVQLTYGKPRLIRNAETRSTDTQQETYPLSAWLTVLPIPPAEAVGKDKGEDDDDDDDLERFAAEWTLLSLDVMVQAKTGEFNHQLETSSRQRFDLHRMAERAMSREEQRVRQAALAVKAEEAKTKDKDGDVDMMADAKPPTEPARPLNALFHLAHTFLLSWQLEMLSAQALALRRGIWAAGDANPLQVTPIRFLDHQTDTEGLLGILSISFWRVDDSYGPPTICDLVDYDKDGNPVDEQVNRKEASEKLREHIPREKQNQLVLCIRADTERGIRVSISGGSALQAPDTPAHSQRAARELMEAASNPLALSASDALLAATRLCAEQKCRATVQALRQHLPDWIELSLERCAIVVAASVQYHGIDKASSKNRPILFRLGCDARTGSFVALFARGAHLLRRLAGNDTQASEAMAVRLAMVSTNRRRQGKGDWSGRVVRDAFDSLIRSVNALGQRVGVGGEWDDRDEQSPSLRKRRIAEACTDVRQALIVACGMSALYGLSSLAIGTAFGLNAMPDMAGKAVSEDEAKVDGTKLLNTPPISILLGQEMSDVTTTSMDGVTKKDRSLHQFLFAISCLANENGIKLVPMEIEVVLDSPVSPVFRKALKIVEFCSLPDQDMVPERIAKKRRVDDSSEGDDLSTMQEVDVFAGILSTTHEALES